MVEEKEQKSLNYNHVSLKLKNFKFMEVNKQLRSIQLSIEVTKLMCNQDNIDQH